MNNKQTDFSHLIAGNYLPTKWESFRRFARVALRVLVVAVEVVVFAAAWLSVRNWVVS